jgi:hypothetical protein
MDLPLHGAAIRSVSSLSLRATSGGSGAGAHHIAHGDNAGLKAVKESSGDGMEAGDADHRCYHRVVCMPGMQQLSNCTVCISACCTSFNFFPTNPSPQRHNHNGSKLDAAALSLKRGAVIFIEASVCTHSIPGGCEADSERGCQQLALREVQ